MATPDDPHLTIDEDGTGDDGEMPEAVRKGLDASLGIQQRLVVRHVDKIRRDHPDHSPREVIEDLQDTFLKAVTLTGAAVGGSAAIPGVGTVAALGMGAGEVLTFLQASTLFTLAVAHVHGLDVEDVERRRTLVLTVLTGESGRDAVGKAAERLPGPLGGIVAGRLSTGTLRELNSGLLKSFIRRFAIRQGALVFGRLVPFGIGALIGGSGNRLLGRNVVRGAKEIFGPAPRSFPEEVSG